MRHGLTGVTRYLRAHRSASAQTDKVVLVSIVSVTAAMTAVVCMHVCTTGLPPRPRSQRLAEVLTNVRPVPQEVAAKANSSRCR